MTADRKMTLAALAAAGCALVGLGDRARFAPRLLFNTTASAPIGFYVLRSGTPVVGEWVAIKPPPRLARWMANRRYLPSNVPLLKQVAALPGQGVCGERGVLSIDGQPVARARARDRRGRALTPFQGCRRLVAGEIMLVNAQPDSLDSRYFGPLPAAGVVGRALPVWTWEARR
jgi:conjugative transfer signal peptidase TraF